MKSKILELHNHFLKNQDNIIKNLEIKKSISIKNNDLNAIITNLYDKAILEAKKTKFNLENNLLAGIDYSLKDNISTKNIKTTGGSNFLKNYIPSFNATVYNILKKQQAILTSKCNLDEFGLGGTGIYSAFGKVKNNFDKSRSPGGSSSGSVVLVSTGAATFSIGTDTGDSIRRPACFTNVVGYKPTYGLVSRYGVFPYAPSMDHVGIISYSVADANIVAEKIIKFDEKDFTSQKKEGLVAFDKLQEKEKINFIVIKNLLKFLPDKQKQKFNILLDELKKKGHQIVFAECDYELAKILGIVYQIITYGEAYSCYANLSGVTFGENVSEENKNFEDKLMKNRTEFFGKELKRRFTIGAFLTMKENYESIYLKSKKLRTLFINEIKTILNNGDCLLMPASTNIAQEISDLKDREFDGGIIDDILMLSNFAGTPSITIPYTFINKMPWGVNITCNVFEDQKMFNIALTLENIIDNMKGVKNE